MYEHNNDKKNNVLLKKIQGQLLTTDNLFLNYDCTKNGNLLQMISKIKKQIFVLGYIAIRIYNNFLIIF